MQVTTASASASERSRRSANDKIDNRILHVLQRDGRISNLKLAEQVNLSPSAVLERVKRLKREGWILGYQARLSREKLGMEVVAFVEVQLERMSSELMERFEAAVRERPAILECHMIAGTFDYLLKVLVPDMHACRELVESEIAKLPGVREARTHAGVEGEPGSRSSALGGPGGATEQRIDAIDAGLLRLLQADGRLSIARLAEELDLTPAVVRERLARLCRKGVILGYVAVLNEAKFNSGLLVFSAVRVSGSHSGIAHALKGATQRCPEIVECHEVTGNFDFLLKTRVPNMARYHELIESTVWTLAGVREVRTYAAIDEIKNTARIPL
ncbi:MAG TPA: Lrp/AsnC ligand binding domain-containing protein [Burkholderiaceae bacterium]